MSRWADNGAISLKSKVNVFPSAKRVTIKPPPPILPLEDDVTASANPTATAASTALPSFFNIWIPT